MQHVARGEVGLLLKAAMDRQGLSKAGLAKLFQDRYGGTFEGHRSQIFRMLKGQAPRRDTRIKLARTLGEPDDYFDEQPDEAIVDTALLTRIVDLLEEQPDRPDIRPLLEELAAQLGELAVRLRQVARRQDVG